MIEDLAAGLGSGSDALVAIVSKPAAVSTVPGSRSSIDVSVSGHRPIIEPFIIQSFQSPFMCWRIQFTMSSHHDAAGTPAAPDCTHDLQLDSIRSGSPHIIEPIDCPLVTR